MDVFSNLMVIGECLLDTRRTNAFVRAIKNTVKFGDIGLDVGTGSGILAMTMARTGAKHVYAIDIAPDIVTFAKGNVKKNKLEDVVTVKQADAKEFSLKKPVDVMTMELMDTWLVAEHQAVVMNALHANNTIDEHTKLIPYRYQCVATPVHYDFSFYGLSMPFIIQARNFGVRGRIKEKLSQRIIVNDLDFSQPIDIKIHQNISINFTKSGVCNALVLESRTFLAPGISVWGTSDMNMPVIIPLPERKVTKGEQKELTITYRMAEGFKTFKVEEYI